MSEDKSLDYKKRFSSELTTLPVFRDDQMWNNGDLVGPDLQVAFFILLYIQTFIFVVQNSAQCKFCVIFLSKSPYSTLKTHTHTQNT